MNPAVNQRRNLRTKLLAGCLAADLAIIHLDPMIAYVEEGMEMLLKTLLLDCAAAQRISNELWNISSLYSLLFRVIQIILDDSAASGVSVDDVTRSIIDQPPQQLNGATLPDSNIIIQQISIAAIGWCTLLFSWTRSTLPKHCAIKGGSSVESVSLHLENCSRPVGSFIRLSAILPSMRPKEPQLENLLYLSMLNFYSLAHVGRLQIQWVPHLSEHLVLHIRTRTLQLFKYPSICILALIGGDYQILNNRIMTDDRHNQFNSMHREVLLSLRFIFGSTRKSRKLAYRLAFPTLENRDNAFDALLQGKIDHLLQEPVPLLHGKVATQDFLAPWTDFPLFGERMVELQRYNSLQQPTKTHKMVRDRRDPARWYLLWVVLLVGGLSVILSALQLVVGCVQLGYAARDQV